MGQIRQKEIANSINGTLYYEITFQTLNKRWLTVKEYDELMEIIELYIEKLDLDRPVSNI